MTMANPPEPDLPPPPGAPVAPASPPALNRSRLARFAVAVIVLGFVVFVLGIFPELIRLDITPGIGLLQIGLFMAGLSLMTLGGYIYAYATRHRALPRRLREDVGVRLMATGLVIAAATGFADVLGIGSHFGADRPLLGPLQALGICLGILVIGVGVILYARR
jgi:hypothetical protein